MEHFMDKDSRKLPRAAIELDAPVAQERARVHDPASFAQPGLAKNADGLAGERRQPPQHRPRPKRFLPAVGNKKKGDGQVTRVSRKSLQIDEQTAQSRRARCYHHSRAIIRWYERYANALPNRAPASTSVKKCIPSMIREIATLDAQKRRPTLKPG